jgi:hypothetical protein
LFVLGYFFDKHGGIILVTSRRTGVAAIARGAQAMQEGHRQVADIRQ